MFCKTAVCAFYYILADALVGTWTGYCTQTAYSNEAGDEAFCTPKASGATSGCGGRLGVFSFTTGWMLDASHLSQKSLGQNARYQICMYDGIELCAGRGLLVGQQLPLLLPHRRAGAGRAASTHTGVYAPRLVYVPHRANVRIVLNPINQLD